MSSNYGLFNKKDRDDKRKDRESKLKERRDHRIAKIKALTAKALAVAQKRKWLVFLIGLGIAVYMLISTGGLGSILQLLKFK